MAREAHAERARRKGMKFGGEAAEFIPFASWSSEGDLVFPHMTADHSPRLYQSQNTYSLGTDIARITRKEPKTRQKRTRERKEYTRAKNLSTKVNPGQLNEDKTFEITKSSLIIKSPKVPKPITPALLARLETMETHMSRMKGHRQSAEDFAVRQMMRIHVLEARAQIDMVEDTGSSC
nr:hypothetical protein [Tanacetum cinerariifolium]